MKEIITLFFLSTFLILFPGCILTSRTIEGKYVYLNEKFFISSELFLSSENTYRFILRNESTKQVDSGKYTFNKLEQKIILHSSQAPPINRIKVSEYQLNTDSIRIHLTDFENIPMFTACISLKNRADECKYLNNDGEVSFPKMRVDSIFIYYFIDTVRYKARNSADNYFDMKILLPLIPPLYLDSSSWVIKHKKLIPFVKGIESYRFTKRN